VCGLRLHPPGEARLEQGLREMRRWRKISAPATTSVFTQSQFPANMSAVQPLRSLTLTSNPAAMGDYHHLRGHPCASFDRR
jgi:hypothetical protein